MSKEFVKKFNDIAEVTTRPRNKGGCMGTRTVMLYPRVHELVVREKARVEEATGIGTSIKREVNRILIERLGSSGKGLTVQEGKGEG